MIKKKLQQKLAKAAKKKERVWKAQIRQQQQEQRQQEAAEIERLRAEQKLARKLIHSIKKTF